MTNKEINKYIHVEIMGLFCNHESAENVVGDWVFCYQCGNSHRIGEAWDLPDYCSDDSPRRLLNEVVTKVMDEDWLYYDHALKAAAMRGEFFAGLVYTATAEQIARACVEAHKESQ